MRTFINRQIATKAGLRELGMTIDPRFAKIEGELTLVKWMLGILIAGVASLIVKSFF